MSRAREIAKTGGAIYNGTLGATTPAAVTTTALVATTADINAGTIDGTVIGGSTAAAGSFTTGAFSTSIATGVGIIKDIDSNSVMIGAGAVNLRMIDITGDIRPVTADGLGVDATIDLGDAGARFKDLYLSGTVNAGAATFSGDIDAGTRVSSSSAGGTRFDLTSADTQCSLIANYFTTAVPLVFYTSALERMRLDTSGALVLNNAGGDAQMYFGGTGGTNRMYLARSGGDALLWNVDSGAMRFATNNAEVMRISGSSLLVGTTSPSAGIPLTAYYSPTSQMNLGGAGNIVSNNTYFNGTAWVNRNSAVGGAVLQLNTDGSFAFRRAGTGASPTLNYSARIDASGYLYSLPTYGLTTSSSANMFVATDGSFQRSTSSLRYKNTITDATHGLTELLILRPVTYKGNNDGDTVFGGLIAEEVHDAGLTEFVQYNDEGKPDALAYSNMVSLCIKSIQEQQAIIEALTARLEALEGA